MYRLALGVLLVLAVTRLPLAPKYLYYFDSVNFALAIDEFDPSKHQPQPPGYPLFVALLRLVHLAVPKVELTFPVAGVLVAAGAAVLLYRLTTSMFNERAALFAVALFIFNPPCWFGGITNQVRLSLALCSTGVALLAWRALQQPVLPKRLYFAFAALGVAAGFRPDMGALLTPLLLYAWWCSGRRPAHLAIAIACTAIAAIPWMLATAYSVGGVPQWLTLMWSYSRDQFRGSSAAFGAPTTSAWKMATQAFVWTGLGAIPWIWAVPFVRIRTDVKFLIAWLGPIFLFNVFIHIGDPDQALGTIPGVCLVGGAVLDAFLSRYRINSPIPALIGVAAMNAAIFFYPPGRLARASGYGAVAFVDGRIQSVFESIREVKAASEPSAILYHRAITTWRHLMYYFPDDYVFYLADEPGDYSWILRRRMTTSVQHPATTLPGVKRAILIAPNEDPLALLADGWHKHGRIYYRDLQPGAQITVGPYRLTQPIQ
jgi:hypothetical protein